MTGNMLITCLVVSVFGIVFSNPLLPNSNDHNTPRCMQPATSGLCLAYFPSYYYNPSTETCESFIYGGCQGNENRFATIQECLAACGGFKPETHEFKLQLESDEDQSKSEEIQSESGENQSVTAEENPCSLPSVMGPCRAMMPRFYFNGDDCESFIYGGCDGNENNFKTKDECKQRCSAQSSEETDSSENVADVGSQEESENKSEEA